MSTSISATLVKELRERTGAGMMECKRALEECHGDLDKAADLLRIKSGAKAEKKIGRTTAEGIIVTRTSSDGKHAILLEVNCETDFVARDQNFVAFTNAVADKALAAKAKTLAEVLALPLQNNETVEEARKTLVSKIGENIQVRRFVSVESSSGQIAAYVHGTRIGALVDFSGGDISLGKDLAMHIIASMPLVVSPADVPADVIAKEKEIFSAQALNSGKPANIIEKMIEGRIKKFLDEVSLLGQPFVKNPDQTIAQVLQPHKAQVHHFVRFAVGEGIEKKTEDFAAEVMAQIQRS